LFVFQTGQPYNNWVGFHFENSVRVGDLIIFEPVKVDVEIERDREKKN
jgi:hypothetical protein